MEILLLIAGLLLFVSLVVLHEFGHFIMARRNGVDVEEFGIGFPPKILTFFRDNKGTAYTLNLLPLGGFVRLKGEHDADREPGTFGAASFLAKTKIILAGVIMNLITAWVMLTILAATGIPRLPLPNGENQFTIASDTKVTRSSIFVGYIESDGPADQAGLRNGDELKRIYAHYGDEEADSREQTEHNEDGHNDENVGVIESSSDVRTTVEDILQDGAPEVHIEFVRDGEVQTIEATPRTLQEVADSELTDEPKGYLGIQPYDYVVQKSTWSSPVVAAGLIAQYSKLTYQALGGSIASLFQGKGGEASENVSGPVGIFVVLRDGTALGFGYIFLIIALLSLTLAIMNTLPIPALDGGKLFVMGLFRLMKKPLTQRLEERIHGTGFMLLLVLFAVITVVDLRRFIF